MSYKNPQSDEFYDLLSKGDVLCKTSGVPPGDWKIGLDKALKNMPEDGRMHGFLVIFIGILVVENVFLIFF